MTFNALDSDISKNIDFLFYSPCTFHTMYWLNWLTVFSLKLHQPKRLPMTQYRFSVNRWHQGLPLWSSGQSSWLQIRRWGFNSRLYHIFEELVCLEWGPHSLVSRIGELVERKSSGSVLENRDYGHGESDVLIMWHSSIRKIWRQLRRQAVIALSLYFARRLRPRIFVFVWWHQVWLILREKTIISHT
jgi:hypothetical protein